MPDSKKLCFIIMPFKDDMKEVYREAIKPACEKAGFVSLRVDELKGAFNINRKIIEHIFSSNAIIADLTDWNPNVFYEMGVAHAIDNKTITIIQKKNKLPFDVVTYRGIFYEQTEAGLVKLRDDIVDSLQTLAEWRNHPSNPVQDFKPRNAFVLQSEFDKLQKILQQKDELLRAAQMGNVDAQKQLREKDTSLEQAAKQVAGLQNELVQKQTWIAVLEKEIKNSRQPAAPQKKLLRAQPLAELSVDAVEKMLQEKGLFDTRYNKSGKGLQHQYETSEQGGEKLVSDHATGLMWQQSGSSNSMTYAGAEKYVRELNAKKFAGCKDWRLPTLEEAMSLMEPAEKNNDLYIDPVFDKAQRLIWTADQKSAGVAWSVYFYYGYCHYSYVFNDSYVRAVRSGQSIF